VPTDRQAAQDRRVNPVQLARLAVSDLLALLGLPVHPARPELRGKRVRPDHRGRWDRPGRPDREGLPA
jgi:hypothetical protein